MSRCCPVFIFMLHKPIQVPIPLLLQDTRHAGITKHYRDHHPALLFSPSPEGLVKVTPYFWLSFLDNPHFISRWWTFEIPEIPFNHCNSLVPAFGHTATNLDFSLRRWEWPLCTIWHAPHALLIILCYTTMRPFFLSSRPTDLLSIIHRCIAVSVGRKRGCQSERADQHGRTSEYLKSGTRFYIIQQLAP